MDNIITRTCDKLQHTLYNNY